MTRAAASFGYDHRDAVSFSKTSGRRDDCGRPRWPYRRLGQARLGSTLAVSGARSHPRADGPRVAVHARFHTRLGIVCRLFLPQHSFRCRLRSARRVLSDRGVGNGCCIRLSHMDWCPRNHHAAATSHTAALAADAEPAGIRIFWIRTLGLGHRCLRRLLPRTDRTTQACRRSARRLRKRATSRSGKRLSFLKSYPHDVSSNFTRLTP